MGVILEHLEVGRSDRSSRGAHIAIRPADGATVCEVEGAIDAGSTAYLAEGLDVALRIEPGNTVLLDLTRVDWMALLDVCSVVDKARRTHRNRRIVVRYVQSAHREHVAAVPNEEADETRPASAAGSRQDQHTGDLMPVSALR